MKIPELAKKLDISPKTLRVYAQKFGFDLGRKSRTIKDKLAEKLELKIRELLEEKRQREAEKEKEAAKIEKVEEKKAIAIPKVISVKEFAARIDQPVTAVIKSLMKNKVVATINESIDFDTAAIVARELEVEVVPEEEGKKETKELEKEETTNLLKRPPVVVVLGHVDHGKTTLLDKIREANVVGGEAGGITQHIGAYQVELRDKEGKERKITFLDTPGHEAFSAMRAHGAKITDIAILVVAANDGVKPQTQEAIRHAKAAGVPIIVAINKIDLPNIDIEKVKKQLSEEGLNPEDWGGSTPIVEISAKTGKNLSELLELVLLESELEELKADFGGRARGVVVESNLDKKIGPVATLLVQKGRLHPKEIVVTSSGFGKIKVMKDFSGKKISEAGPSTPVKITGLHKVPNFGELFEVVENEKAAKLKIAENIKRQKIRSLGLSQVTKSTKPGSLRELKLVLKADVAGSLKAISESLSKLGNQEVGVKVIRQDVGAISESDIMDAQAAGALVLGFKTSPTFTAKKFSNQLGVTIKTYEVIYELIEDVKTVLAGMLEKKKVRVDVARGKILKIFAWEKKNKLIGVKVQDGVVTRDLLFSKKSGNELVGEGKIFSMKIKKDKVDEAKEGSEVGLLIDIETKLSEGDKLVFYKIEEQARTL